jgi:hypothetical protein
MLLSNYKPSDNDSNPSERSRGFFDCLRLRRNYKRNRKKAFSKKGQFYSHHHHKNISNFILILPTTSANPLSHINPSSFFFSTITSRESRQSEYYVKRVREKKKKQLMYSLLFVSLAADDYHSA